MKNCLSQTTFAGLLLTIISLQSSRAADLLVPGEYPTIQAAVNAASSGDTIRIAAGEYREQANVINKKLALAGEPGAVLHAHAEMQTVPWNNNVAIFAFERADVVVSNLVLEGNQQGDYYPNRFMGIIFRSSSGRVENCTIRGFRGTSDLQERAVNINNILDNGILDVSVVGCSFSDNWASLLLFGSDNNPAALSTRFTVRSNTFTGLGAAATFPHYGIWIAYGAEGSVIGNTITDHTYSEFENNARGISASDGRFVQRGFFASLKPVVYSGNIFSNNTAHITAMVATGSKITNNVFAATAQDSSTTWGIGISGAGIIIADNNFADIPEAIRLFGRGDTLLNVPRGIALNTKLTGNWFTNVTSVLRTGESVSFEETGTELCCFAPRFQRMELAESGKVRAKVRTWHGEAVVIESSTDLKQWAAVQTNTATLPLFEYEATDLATAPREFFRIRKAR